MKIQIIDKETKQLLKNIKKYYKKEKAIKKKLREIDRKPSHSKYFNLLEEIKEIQTEIQNTINTLDRKQTVILQEIQSKLENIKPKENFYLNEEIHQ